MRPRTLLTSAALLISVALLQPRCDPPDTRSEQMRQWLAKSRQGCQATASFLKTVRRGVAAFEAVYEAELERTKKDQRPLGRYNPRFLTRLDAALGKVDTTRGPLAKRLAQQVWASHYRFVKSAPEVLPRLHQLLVVLAQLRSTIAVARRLEKRYRKLLHAKATSPPKPGKGAPPPYGVLLEGRVGAVFTGPLTRPVKRAPAGCVDATLAHAAGYRLAGGQCRFFGSEGESKPDSPDPKGTLRLFSPTDAELLNRVECRGTDQIVYTAHLYHLVQIKLLLAAIKKLDLRGLTVAFSRSGE